MYHLITGLWKQLTAETVHSILIVGLDNAGKTSFFDSIKFYDYETSQLTNVSTSHTQPTVGLNVSKISVAPGTTFQLWDLGGQDSLRPLWKHYMENASGIIFVVDSCDYERFTEASRELHGLLQESLLAHTPLLVLANKQDCQDAKPSNIVSLSLRIPEYSTDDVESGVSTQWDRDIFVTGVSCKTGLNLVPAIEWLRHKVQTNTRRNTKNN